MARVDFASKLKSSITPMVAATEPAPAPVAPEDASTIATSEPDVAIAPVGQAEPAGVEETADQPSVEQPGDRPSEAQTATRRATPRSRRSPAPRASKEAPAGDDEPVTAPFAIELPISLDELLTEHRKRTRKSHRAVLLDAIEATYDELQELIDNELGRDRAAEKKNLFGRSSRTAAPVPVDDGEERITHTFRVTASNRELITKIADEFEAPSRNFLVVTAYKRYLKPAK